MRSIFARLLIIAGLIGGATPLSDTAAASQTSTLELQRDRATSLFDRRLDALSATRTLLADDWKTYERACRGKVTTGRGAGVVFLRSELVWFVQAVELDNETMPACRMLTTAITTRSQAIAQELQQIDEDARRGGIYPGVMRDLKRRYGFE